MAAIETR